MSRIVIVEDEEVTALALELFCQKIGLIVLQTCANKSEAIEAIRCQKPDLLLCDIHLEKERDGIEVAQFAYTRYGVPTLFLTAYYDRYILEQIQELPFYGYIIKPYNEVELEATLRLAQRRLLKERPIKQRYIELGEMIFDMQECNLYDQTKEVAIGKKCKRLLYFLAKNKGSVQSYRSIIEYVYDGEEATIDSLRHLVNRTRQLLPKGCLKAVRGVGYQLL